ncbi:MAG: hypothetical protein K2Y05_04030 [Hyphomicrobiaceae bacterium]|nr:hypothetical protein [Hyphomicrobiaceae bacterium]
MDDTFTPVEFAPPYRMDSIRLLFEALVEANWDPLWESDIAITPSARAHSAALANIAAAQDDMRSELVSGALVAFVYHDGLDKCFEISKTYWAHDHSVCYLEGPLFTLGSQRIKPDGLDGKPVLVLRTELAAWMKARGLRSPKEAKTARLRKPSPTEAAYLAEGLRILKVRDGFSPRYRRADLCRDLQDWASASWDHEVSESTVKRYVEKIRSVWDAENAR